ncbi:zinc finger protein DZIP1L [Drosophila guanche]|uniref:Blast:Zinc finger protein DZIP1L n=1 Tax=Drosophila guanche TaxID=7266 RepID=A0A3B0JSE9_DROGU|nr:zinc finger protein DZIP1L [Drosophila guanche]SPP83342.1 blast:Zinc finger protein DZIP1L [Drosophila guanche]
MDYKSNYPQMVREAGFKLRQYRDGPLDWRLMGSYETERILREQNFELVDKALQHLSEAPLGTVLETHILDSGIAKYFVMSQYAIQYLICCRTYLDECVTDLREAHEISQQEIAKLRKSLVESSNEVVQLHKRITEIEAIREVVYPCHLCTKNFISNEALNVHIGRKHRVGTPPSVGANAKDKDNDMNLINTIKMELEIKQLKERLNAAERNIKERSSGSKRPSPRQDQRNVGIQSNLSEAKEKDELHSEVLESEASERKEQMHGLAERLSNFEVWQTEQKQSNEQFIQDINQKLEGLSHALEQSKKVSSNSHTEAPPTPRLEDLERILTEKVTEIGQISANKLEEVVTQLETGYNDKLQALERELKQLRMRKETQQLPKPQPVASVHSAGTSKIPKPVSRREETTAERIRKQVESEFLKNKADDETYPIEEAPPPAPVEVQVEINEQPSAGSSSSHPTYTKPDVEAAASKPEARETTDIDESLSQEDAQAVEVDSEHTLSDEGSETSSFEAETQPVHKAASSRPPARVNIPQRPLTRKDARKLLVRKMSSHGFDLKSKTISHTTMKRINGELTEQRNKLKLKYPHFYATRNRIRKFVEKLCSAKMPPRAKELLKHTTPLQPMEAPQRGTNRSTHSSHDEEDASDTSEHSESRSSSPQRPVDDDFKARLEQILVKPVAIAAPRTAVKSSLSARPVPLPRKRVMFNTMGAGKGFNDSEDDLK